LIHSRRGREVLTIRCNSKRGGQREKETSVGGSKTFTALLPLMVGLERTKQKKGFALSQCFGKGKKIIKNVWGRGRGSPMLTIRPWSSVFFINI